MPLAYARSRVARVFSQRCFYLFAAMVLLIIVAPFTQASVTARILGSAVNLFILLAAVAAVGRGLRSFVIALLLAAPAMILQILGISGDSPQLLLAAWSFSAAFYVVTLIYLLAYVLRRDVMTADKLYGAAAAYVMIGVLWVYFYAILESVIPGSFSGIRPGPSIDIMSYLLLSFGMMTSNGAIRVAPVLPQAEALAVLEQIVGVLFVAVLIARLAGIYPPRSRSDGSASG